MNGLREIIKENRGYLAILVMLALVVYGLSLKNGFVWDDHHFIEGVKEHSQLTLGNIIKSEYPVAGTGAYRPVRDVFYPPAFLVCGFAPACYRGFTVGLHLLVTIMIFLLGVEMLGDKKAALVGAGLFAVHPVHVEAVVWITAGFDLISAVFYITALYFFALSIKAKNQKLDKLTKLSWLMAGLAMLSNELALTLPLVIMAYDWLVVGNQPRKRGEAYLPYWALAGVYVVARLGLGVANVTYVRPFPGLWQTGLLSLLILGRYLQSLVLPVKMSVDTILAPGITGLFGIDHDPAKVLTPLNLASSGMLVALGWCGTAVAAAGWSLRKHKQFAFGLVWVILGLIPVLQLTPLRVLWAERYTYFASMGAAVAVMVVIHELLKRKQWTKLVLGTAIFVMAGWGYLGANRIGDWQSDVSLWTKTLSENPMSAAATNSLAAVYMVEGNYQAALPYSEKTVELNPGVERHQMNLINVYQQLGMYDKMVAFMESLLERQPGNMDLIFSIAQVYEEKLNDPARAHEYYAKAAAYAPDLPIVKAAMERTATASE